MYILRGFSKTNRVFGKALTLIITSVLLILFTTSCVSGIDKARINLKINDVKQSELLKLINGNDDLNFYRLGLEAMEKTDFLNQNGQAYGYYAIETEISNDWAANTGLLGFFNTITLFIPTLIGVPTDVRKFDLTVNFYIFDSTGKMIKIYKNSNSFEKVGGVYWGQNPDKKASRYFSFLFKEILNQINIQSDEINYILNEAGPVTIENMQAARVKITEFFKLNKK
jgi:hypothetical protein